jgi:hypothetical protein
LKGKSKKRRTTRAITPEIEDEEEECIDEDTYESEGNCIIVASSRSNPRKRGWYSDRLPLLIDFPYNDVNEDDKNQRIDKDEEGGEDGEKQTEQVEEKEGASSAHCVEGSDDGEREAPEAPYIEPEPTQNEERLQEDARGYRASDSARLAGSVNNAHDVPLTEELVNVQGTASPSKTLVMLVSPSDVVSTPRRELEYGTDTRQVIWNDLITNRANITKKQAEHTGLTTQHEDNIEGAQSHHSDVVCDEDEIVVANGP